MSFQSESSDWPNLPTVVIPPPLRASAFPVLLPAQRHYALLQGTRQTCLRRFAVSHTQFRVGDRYAEDFNRPSFNSHLKSIVQAQASCPRTLLSPYCQSYRLPKSFNYNQGQQMQREYKNQLEPRFLEVFRKPRSFSQMPSRYVVSNIPDTVLHDNSISTTKTNLLTFLPVNLIDQFTRPSNIYFLCVGILQIIPSISLTYGQPTVFFPLSIVIILSIMRQLFQELKRYKNDKKQNQRKIEILTSQGWIQRNTADILIGDIIKVKNDEPIPADILLLQSSSATAYVQTMNLDGQSSLKIKKLPTQFLLFKQLKQQQLSKLNLQISYQRPDQNLYSFTGKALTEPRETILNNNHVMLRGSVLKMTTQVVGMVLYNGFDTKVMLNATQTHIKRSSLQETNKRVVITLCILIGVITFVYAIISAVKSIKLSKYLDIANLNFFTTLVKFWGTWFLIISNFIPISLNISLEVVNLINANVIQYRSKIGFSQNSQPTIQVQSSNLCSQLGQVQHILSDKTGTLTCNIMNFKMISLRGKIYGNQRGSLKIPSQVTNVDFQDGRFNQLLKSSSGLWAERALQIMSICHSVISQLKEDRLTYNSSSPDELALVNFSRLFGYQFRALTQRSQVIILKDKSKQLVYKLLYNLQFDNYRRRSSVIVQDTQGRYVLLSKGADSVMQSRVGEQHKQSLEYKAMLADIKDFAIQGLRTLLLCYRQISKEQFKAWQVKYREALTSLSQSKIQIIWDLQSKIQVDLIPVCVTAVQDKLQREVPQTIKEFKKRGIKFWMLTGDKKQTAINIGYSCGLIEKSSELIILDCPVEYLDTLLEKTVSLVKNNLDNVLVISGQCLTKENPLLMDKLIAMALSCSSVIACRVSASQKQFIAELIQNKSRILAIGDGANDVAMITKAHVGIGIKGLQGGQASANADFSIKQFKQLRSLMLVDGCQIYRRNSFVILYSMYKNMLISIPLLFYAYISNFSGLSYYNGWVFQLYNIFFTSLPIIVYAIVDRAHSDSQYLSEPKLYEAGLFDRYFNVKVCLKWVLEVSVEGVILLFLSFYLSQGSLSSLKLMFNMSMTGMLIFSIIINLTCLKILQHSHGFTLGLTIAIIFSILSFYISYLFVNLFQSTDIYSTEGELLLSFQFWSVSLLVCGGLSSIQFGLGRALNFKIRKNKQQSNIEMVGKQPLINQ